MRFVYGVTSFPEETDGYHLTAYTERFLKVKIDGVLFLDAAGVLLVEFAVVLHKWLLSLESGTSDLYYSSMDFEEEPILALRFDRGHGGFWPESVWAQGNTVPVSLLEARRAALVFLQELGDELRAKLGADLDKTLADASSELAEFLSRA